MVGKHISEVTDNEKLVEHDADVVIKDGVWIGANVTILKGVTVGEGCVIAAGSVVTKNTSPYGIYAGAPAKKIKDRFTPEQLEKHLGLLEKK
ncbi:DapH/DapD/GlmU-related protein [Priestia megaterium]